MENKVIETLLETYNLDFQFAKDYCYYKHEGSGNNWSYGYMYHGPSIKDDFLTILNLLIERID
jgi:hypothetical protein